MVILKPKNSEFIAYMAIFRQDALFNYMYTVLGCNVIQDTSLKKYIEPFNNNTSHVIALKCLIYRTYAQDTTS